MNPWTRDSKYLLRCLKSPNHNVTRNHRETTRVFLTGLFHCIKLLKWTKRESTALTREDCTIVFAVASDEIFPSSILLYNIVFKKISYNLVVLSIMSVHWYFLTIKKIIKKIVYDFYVVSILHEGIVRHYQHTQSRVVFLTVSLFDATCHWRRGWWPPGSFPEQPLSWGQQGNHLRVEVHADNEINHELLQSSTEDNWTATCFFQPHQNRILDEELLDGDQQWCPLVSSLVLGNNPGDRTAASAKGPKKKIVEFQGKGMTDVGR